MSKKLYKIFILSIFIFIIMCNGKSIAVESKNINKPITNWTSGRFNGWTDELKKEEYEKILTNLKNDFGYEGNTINEEMKMKTTISITKKSKVWYTELPLVDDKYKYAIRIRNW